MNRFIRNPSYASWLFRVVMCCSLAAQLYGEKQYGVDPTVGIQELRTDDLVLDQLVPVAGGKMLIRGGFNYVDNTPNTQGIARLDNSGRLDLTFKTTGLGQVSAIAVTSTAEIWVSGSNGSPNFFVRKLTANGTALPGVPAVPVAQNDDVIATTDGGFYVFDWRNGNVARYTADAIRKDDFAPISLGGSEIIAWAVGPHDEIALLVWGPWANELQVFSATGAIQPSLTSNFPADFNAYSLAYDSIGRLIVSGGGTGQPKPTVLRFLQSGELDPGFSGVVPDIWAWITSIHVMPGGNLLATGTVGGATGILEFSSDGVFQRLVSLTATGGQPPGTFYAFPMGTSEYVVSGIFDYVGGIPKRRIARVQFGGGPSVSFVPNLEGRAQVNSVARSSSGEILFGGNFTRVGQTSVGGLAGLNPNGGVDANFPIINWVTSILPTQDGGTLILGGFMPFPGTNTMGLVKLRGDRSVDTSFLSGVDLPGVNSALLLPDGSTLLGGSSGPYNISRLLTRVTPQGALDPTFFNPPPSSTWEAVTAIAIHPAGGYLVAGTFTEFQGEPRDAIARVDSNGIVDHAFVPESVLLPYWPRTLSVLPDGRFYLLSRRTAAPEIVSSLIRFSADGTLDNSFVSPFDIDLSYWLAPDGSLYLAGVNLPGVWNLPITLVHILANGQIDPNFVFSLDGGPIAYSFAPDGSLVVGGYFTQINGLRREGLARIAPIPLSVTIDGPVSQNVGLRGSITLSAHVVSAAGPISYQWYFNGAIIGGATTDKLELIRVMPKDSGAYTVSAMAAGERALSPAVSLNVTKGSGH